MTGRGWGKTRTMMEWAACLAGVEGKELPNLDFLPGSKGLFITQRDQSIQDVLFEGESGFLSVIDFETYVEKYNRSSNIITLKNGSTIQGFSAAAAETMRGPQFHWGVMDEVAVCTLESFRQFDETIRLPHPNIRYRPGGTKIMASTPQATPAMLEAVERVKSGHIKLVSGSTVENSDNLASGYFDRLADRYEGTTRGEQELHGKLILVDNDALLTQEVLDEGRVLRAPESIKRVVIGVEPSVTANKRSDECGIVVAGLAEDGQIYVLGDYTCKKSTREWASDVVRLAEEYDADEVWVEDNQGKELLKVLFGTIPGAENLTLRYTTARRKKGDRARPAANLYESGKVHHVRQGLHKLEQEWTNWVPGRGRSPNRIDACVYAVMALHQHRSKVTLAPAPNFRMPTSLLS